MLNWANVVRELSLQGGIRFLGGRAVVLLLLLPSSHRSPSIKTVAKCNSIPVTRYSEETGSVVLSVFLANR